MKIKDEILRHKEVLTKINIAKNIDELPVITVNEIKSKLIDKLEIKENEGIKQEILEALQLDDSYFIELMISSPSIISDMLRKILTKYKDSISEIYSKSIAIAYDSELYNLLIEYKKMKEKENEFNQKLSYEMKQDI